MLGQLSMGATRRLNRHYQNAPAKKHKYVFDVWGGGTVHRTPVDYERKRYKYKTVKISGYIPNGCFGLELSAGNPTPDIIFQIEDGAVNIVVTGYQLGSIQIIATPTLTTETVGNVECIRGGYFEAVAVFDEYVYNYPTNQQRGVIAGVAYNFSDVLNLNITVEKE